MALPLRTHSNDYVFGRGKLYVDLFDANSAPTGERFLGNCPGFTLSVESEQFDHFKSTTGLRSKDLTVTLSVNFGGEILTDDVSAENMALFLGGSTSTVSQSATPVVDESITPILSDREYQLGTTTSNPTGVRSVGSVTVESAEGHDAGAAATTTAYALGDFVQPATPNDRYYMCVAAGTSGGSAPTWPTDGSTVTDGTVTWRDMGTILRVVTTDYTVDAASGRIYIVPGGGLALAIGYAAALASPVDLELYVGYTPTAGSRTRISSGASGSLTGAVRFIADNAAGSNRDLYIASASLAPSGELPLITEDELASFTISIGVNERDSSTPTIIVDGQLVAGA